MSIAKHLLCGTIESTHWITRAYVEDLTDAELLVRSVPGANHMAWQLGHMIGATGHFLAAVGRETPALPEGFAEAHAPETAASDDPAAFATKAQYLALMDQAKAASLAAVEATPEADFDKPSPEPMREYAPTIGAVLMLLATHWLMHAGQFVPIRRKLGKQPLF
ncbi:MAG: DinB family protein [Planctomycetia bacterium]|jgi:uncharacterized damage-inducible protein DinB|nr:DinB family protein [Planctomycetia bacterium]